MSRIGRKPIPVPAGVKIAIARRQGRSAGPQGQAHRSRCRTASRFEQKDGVLTAMRDHGRASRAARSGARAGRQRRSRRHARLQEGAGHRRRRLSRRAKGQDRGVRARQVASDRVSDSGRNPDRRRQADAHRRQRRGQRRKSARWPRTFVRCVRPTRTSRRACASPANA